MNKKTITSNLLSAVKLLVIAQHQNEDNQELFTQLEKALEYLLVVKLAIGD